MTPEEILAQALDRARPRDIGPVSKRLWEERIANEADARGVGTKPVADVDDL